MCRACCRDHPRIRGEHGFAWEGFLALIRSSPHTRGARLNGENKGVSCGIIPAYAGSTLCRRRHPPRKPDHPRIRGEHSSFSAQSPLSKGSSPHTRGAPGARRSSSTAISDHPRIRGEHGFRAASRGGRGGSSPHTRGARSAASRLSYPWMDHPRIRGEHLVIAVDWDLAAGSSPHTRGALGELRIPHADIGIIPAYAGSTSSIHTKGEVKRDHPRIRGEHFSPKLRFGSYAGSSPHTRGAPPSIGTSSSGRRIIPAYAGSTM